MYFLVIVNDKSKYLYSSMFQNILIPQLYLKF